MAVDAAVYKMVWDMIWDFARGYSARKKDFFENHIEPLQQKMIAIHKDYVSGFQEISRHLRDGSKPASELVEFLKERRRDYEHERTQARDLAAELENVRKAGINDDRWREVEQYCDAIVAYFSASADVGSISWYSDFVRAIESSIRAGLNDVYPGAGFSGNPRTDLLEAIKDALDRGLPRAFQKVSSSYAVLRARFL
jgi:hypothetical protein